MDREARFLDRAGTQEGLLARFQVTDLGCTTDHWWQARRNGRWNLASTRVISLRGSPRSEAQRALAAVLDSGPGSMLHGPSALAWLGLRGFDLREPQVARLRGTSNHVPELVHLHRLRAVRPHDVIVVRGVTTETALRALWAEAARYASPARVDIGVQRIGRLLDAAHRLDLVTWAGLHEMVEDIHQRGRSGTTIMRVLAEARPPGSSPTESRNEDELGQVLADAGARPLRRQRVLGARSRSVAVTIATTSSHWRSRPTACATTRHRRTERPTSAVTSA